MSADLYHFLCTSNSYLQRQDIVDESNFVECIILCLCSTNKVMVGTLKHITNQIEYHMKISDYFKYMKDSISRKLNENSICKHIMKCDKVQMLLYTLSHDDREFLMWLRQTYVECPLKANSSWSQQLPNM
ncbi:unnamed protein product [Malus baccata var. baccata]